MNEDEQICFVIMGFGKKTDHETGRTLNLNATYEEIIEPAVKSAGLRCIRADEVSHSGLIDVPMYEMLMKSDLVIADITTGNSNAIYELGIRHALKPFSTIIMKEEKGNYMFDLSHVNIFSYTHMGEDIGCSEAREKKQKLKVLIQTVMAKKSTDSPLYTFFPHLTKPELNKKDFYQMVNKIEAEEEKVVVLIERGEKAMQNSDFIGAMIAFKKAHEFRPNEPYFIQQYALATYKSKYINPVSALLTANDIMLKLNPDESTDPETLGICGAINKNLFLEKKDIKFLESAIRFYERGFVIRRDYYTGQNFSFCLLLLANHTKNKLDSKFNYWLSLRSYETVFDELVKTLNTSNFEDRNDKKWVYATLAHVCYVLKKQAKFEAFEKNFLEHKPADWELETFKTSLSSLKKQLGKFDPSFKQS